MQGKFEMVRYDIHGKIINDKMSVFESIKYTLLAIILLPMITMVGVYGSFDTLPKEK